MKKLILNNCPNLKLHETIGTLVIPEAYQEVEYLQSSGVQWIDTGITYGSVGKIYLDVTPTQNACFFGCNCSAGEILLG